MAVQTRGGVPRVIPVPSVPTTGLNIQFRGRSNYLEIRNEGGTNALRVFFESETDFTTATNYVTVPINGTWVAPAKTDEIWLASAAGTTPARVIVFHVT